jgi:hypothetical protein
MTVVVFLCSKIPSSSGVDFCLNNSLRGVDRSDRSLCDDRGSDIVSAQESRGGRGALGGCAGCQSYQSRLRPIFALYQNEDRGRESGETGEGCASMQSWQRSEKRQVGVSALP